MTRKLLWAVAIGAASAALAAGWLLQRADAPTGVAVIGDHAPALAQAAGLPAPGGRGAVTVATVNTWIQLDYLQGMGRLCGDACTEDAWLVRVLEPRATGSRKTVFLRLGPFGDGNDWPPVPPCLRAVLAAELASLRPAALPDCVAEQGLPDPVTRTVLPLGLGTI